MLDLKSLILAKKFGGSSGGSSGGITPSGTIEIAENGLFDVTNYANANVNVSGSGGIANGVEYLEFDSNRRSVTSAKTYGNKIFCYQFRGQKDLENVEIPDSVTSIEQYAFYECEKLALTSLPSSLTSISNYAFQDCSNLALTSLPSGLTSIGTSAFQNCSNLALTSLPSGLTSISNYAFQNCENLTELELPSVTSIGNYTFNYCSKLATLIIRSSTLCTLLNVNAFNSTPIKSGTGFIYVPDDLVDTYKSATNWSTYANQIKGISELGV